MTPNTSRPQSYTDQVVRDIPARFGVVEDDVDSAVVDDVAPQAVMLVKPVPVSVQGLVKPLAMKVVRPIPQRVSEQFYNEAFEEGLPMQEMHQAAMVAHDWHRKWTQQDEQGHTMPDEDFYSQQFVGAETAQVDPRQDLHGAKNPSLGESDDDSVQERFKRGLELEESRMNCFEASEAEDDMPVSQVLFDNQDMVSASSCSKSSISSSASSYMVPNVKRRFTGAVVEDYEDIDFDQPNREDQAIICPVAVRPLAVRPVAVRVVRPEPSVDGPPRTVCAPVHDSELSPVSFVDDCSKSSESFMLTLVNRQNDVHVVEDEEENNYIPNPSSGLAGNVITARDGVLHALAVTQGDVDSDIFKAALNPLLKFFSGVDTRFQPTNELSVEGMWLTLSKPSYFACLGDNDNGDPMYTLGRMAFDMFSPTNLVCSLQGNFNPVEIVDDEQRKQLLEKVPKSLREEVESGETVLRTYHIMAAFTIEPSQALFPNAPNKDVYRPIRGIMTTYGYSLPDPSEPNRHSIWFTGGKIEPNNDPADIFAWKNLFTKHPPKHSFGEKAKLLAVKLLMGATVPETMAEDGSMEYEFTRPLGGHGMAYVDVVYLDETLRICKGHRGTVFVFSRIHH